MVDFLFERDLQKERYLQIKRQFKHGFYQDYKFYILPYMPEKFRNRVVYFPEVCNPILDSARKIQIINKLKKTWLSREKDISKKLYSFFTDAENIKVIISPSIYGNIGRYNMDNEKITLMPRYDRSVDNIAMLFVNSLVHYFMFKRTKMKSGSKIWIKKQNMTIEVYNQIFGAKTKLKQKGLTQTLDTEFAGRLAEESARYLEKLGASSKRIIEKPENLTKSENIAFNLLLRNKNKLVSFDEIADWLWEDKSEEKYSEYAITKLVERLKKKSSKNLIQSQRGIGYILHI